MPGITDQQDAQTRKERSYEEAYIVDRRPVLRGRLRRAGGGQRRHVAGRHVARTNRRRKPEWSGAGLAIHCDGIRDDGIDQVLSEPRKWCPQGVCGPVLGRLGPPRVASDEWVDCVDENRMDHRSGRCGERHERHALLVGDPRQRRLGRVPRPWAEHVPECWHGCQEPLGPTGFLGTFDYLAELSRVNLLERNDGDRRDQRPVQYFEADDHRDGAAGSDVDDLARCVDEQPDVVCVSVAEVCE